VIDVCQVHRRIEQPFWAKSYMYLSAVQAMRSILKRKGSVHLVREKVLMQAFADALKKRHCDVNDTVRVEQFQAAWKSLGIVVDKEQAMAIFNKYGQTNLGRLPVTVFTYALLMGAPRAIQKGSSGIIQGPLPQQLSKMPSLAGNIKIMYPQSRKGVFAPSNWDPSLAVRSATLPAAKLKLDFIHGYDGSATASNIFYNKHGCLVYHVAAVGVVYDPMSHSQAFFLGHNDDILCTTLHPDRELAATGQVRFSAQLLQAYSVLATLGLARERCWYTLRCQVWTR
jgi:hypothetical protein